MATLETRLLELAGDRATKLLDAQLDVFTVGDLLRHYPRRIAERGELSDIASLREGDDVTVLAEVRSANVIRNRNTKGSRTEIVVTDGRANLQLIFFGSRQTWQKDRLAPGTRGLFAGKVTVYGRDRHRQLAHPAYIILPPSSELDLLEADEFVNTLIPVYPATKDLRTWTIAEVVKTVLFHLDPVPDPVPTDIRVRHKLMDLDTALRTVHQPDSMQSWFAARRRLKWDEALGVQLALAQRRSAAAVNPATPRAPKHGGLLDAFDAKLPFTLTAGQQQVGEVLAAELNRAHPMHRLLQGEVGSGKTVVALRAMLQVIDAGGQAALLAPTEVLAAQHARSIEAMLAELAQAGRLGGADQATQVTLLTGSLSIPARRAALLDAASGAAGIVIGTHALIQDQVNFAELGLVVVDEQHRFGVEQRDALRNKSARPPHVLVMTATPIPRTVAMTVFGDLDTVMLTELPIGRSPISTTVIDVHAKPAWLERAWQRVREEAKAGRQAFIVCPRIGDGGSEIDTDEADEPADETSSRPRPPLALYDVLAELVEGPLAGLRVAALHGRLPPDEKDAVMRDFSAGRLDVLVATTVIEVGVDVPNASVMVVMDADRFGISQLHQLRGRIGRGSAAGICLLVTESFPGTPARERLDAIASTTDGFELAKLDVQQRREGDVLGVAQSGRRSQLKLLSLLTDEELISDARLEASAVVEQDPDLSEHPLLAAQVEALVAHDRAEYLEKG